jgi:hypothetical protein
VHATVTLLLDTAPVTVGVDPDHVGPPIRSCVVLRRNPALSWAGFDDHWRNEHGPLVMRTGGVTSRMVRFDGTDCPAVLTGD